MREQAGFCKSGGIGAVRQMIYRLAGTSESRRGKATHRLAQLVGITTGRRWGKATHRIAQLAGIAAVATAAFTSQAAAQSNERIVSGNETFAIEAVPKAQATKVPTVLAVDLPAIKGRTVQLQFNQHPLGPVPNGTDFSIGLESCSNQSISNTSTRTVTGGSKQALADISITDCPAQTLLVTYKGLDYRQVSRDGVITGFVDNGGNVLTFGFLGATFEDAYLAREPLTVSAQDSIKELGSSGELADNRLFSFSARHEVNIAARLSLDDTDPTSSYSDIKYQIAVQGELDFLSADAQGNARQLVVLDNMGDEVAVLSPDNATNPTRASAQLTWPATSQRQDFTIQVQGESNVAYKDGQIDLAVTPLLERAGITFSDAAFGVNAMRSASTIVDASTTTIEVRAVQPAAEYAREYERGRFGDFDTVSNNFIVAASSSLSFHPISIEVDIPAIDGSGQAKDISLIFSPHADVNQQPAPGTLRFIISSFAVIKSDCGSLTSSFSSTRGSFGQAFIYRIDSACPAQRLDIRIVVDTQGSTDTPGNFHLSVEGLTDTPRGFALATSFKTSDTYAFTRGSDYQIDAPGRIIAGETSGFGDATLATISGGDFTLDRTLLLESGDLEVAPFATAEYEDVKLLVLIESDNKELLENFAIKEGSDSPHKLVIRSNTDGAIPAYFFWWRARQSLYAMIGRSAEQGEVFTVSVLDTAGNTAPYMGFDQTSELKIRAYGMLYKIGEPSASTRALNGEKDQYGVLERRISRIYPVQGQPDLVDHGFTRPANGDEGLMQVSYASFEAEPIIIVSSLITPPAFGVARFVMPWVYEGEALAGQGDQMVTTSMQLSNLTNKTIGPVRVEVADSSVAGISVDAPAMLFETIAPYTSVEITGTMLTDALPDFGQATLVLTVDGATPQDLTLRRFTDVGGNLYTDNFGTAESFNEFNPTP